jgi:segregation and condensation protein A
MLEMLDTVSKPVLSLPSFEGPLDLLLQLIEQHRLDITAIALAEVADQYLALVRAAPALDPGLLADFLAIGTKLLVVKTRALLPRSPLPAPPSEEDVGEQLARQLREYSQIKQAASALRERDAAGLRTHERIAPPPLPPRREPEQLPPLNIGVEALQAAVERRLALLRSEDTPPVEVPRPKTLTIEEVTGHIQRRLTASAWVTFDDLLSLAVTRAEVIVTLWTVLELYKRQEIIFRQDGLFDQITLGRGEQFEHSAASMQP